MAQKRRKGSGAKGKGRRWAGLCLLAFGIYFLASLLTYHPGDYVTAWNESRVHFPLSGPLVDFLGTSPDMPHGPLAGLNANAGGGFGLLVTAWGVIGLGWIAVWAVPFMLMGWGWNRLFLRPARPVLWRTLAAVPLGATLAAVAAAATAGPGLSGRLGEFLWRNVHGGVGTVGGTLLLGVAAVGFVFLEAEAWDGRWGRVSGATLAWLGRVLRVVGLNLRHAAARALAATGRGLRATLFFLGRSLRDVLLWLKSRPWESDVDLDAHEPRAAVSAAKTPAAAPAASAGETWRPTIVDNAPAPPAEPASAPRPLPTPPAPAPAAARTEGPVVRRVGEGITGEQDVEAAVMEARRQAKPGKRPGGSLISAVRGRMSIPSLDILDDVPEAGPPVAEEELIENSEILTRTLSDFGISGRVGEVHPGPVITRYEYVPGPGVKVSQILNRQDDLALKLRASRIRILAPIPGKAAVGIEVPNRKPAPIFLRRLLETKAFKDAEGPLPLALGKDISGMPITSELSKMPHVLIAGTTGSGKSVCMNALITSLLMKRTPRELRMLMIDPKMLELPMYNGIPHLLMDVVTDSKLAARSLKWALVEMERRYKVLAARGCRNLQSYNNKMEVEGPKHEDEEKLPYIVILIDELADLMITSGKEVEEPIGRLAQTARAVGIHLIVATQRPSVDVITGVLKANFPSRIAFQVASRTDSRTILDQNGAESLLGKGDMLFLPPGQASPLRVHGAFVSEEETQRLADAWRNQGQPTEYQGLEDAMSEPEAGSGALGDDPLFEDAARLVVAAGQASASLLQRRLKVGYARAARLVDMMEMAGVVAPPDGSKAREVLMDDVRLEAVLAGSDV